MEVDLITKIFSEGGLIYVLFFMIVGGFIWKGIPYIVSILESMVKDFHETIRGQQELCNKNAMAFKEALDNISTDFVKRIEMSEAWHQTHKTDINEIKVDLKSIKETIKK